MKAYALGLLLIPLLAVGILSLRPGGIRHQLRNVTRRLRLALVLGGVYVAGTTLLKLGWIPEPVSTFALPVLVVGIALAFVVLGQDRAPERG